MVVIHIYVAKAIFYYLAMSYTMNLSLKVYIGQKYLHPTRWENNIVIILHIDVDIAIFLLFCDHQETKSK